MSVLLAGLFACTGDQGPPGEPGTPGSPGEQGQQGEQGEQGDPGTPAPTTGTLTGTITDGVAGDPLAGVQIAALDLGGGSLGTATTGADGAFSVTVTAGPVDLTFAKPHYTSPGVLHSGVGLGQTIHIAVQLAENASGAPSVALTAPANDVGYGAQVTLSAAAADPDGDTLAYTWANTTVPVLGSVSGAGATATLTMPTLTQAFAYRPDSTNPGQFISGYTLADRIGVVPILPDTRGAVTAKVTVADGRGQSATASLTINAASVQTSTQDVAIRTRVYLNSGHGGASAWSLLSAPTTSTAALVDPTSRTPYFIPDLAGQYTFAEGAQRIIVYAGTWRGMVTGGSGNSVTPDAMCLVCHGGSFPGAPAEQFTPWAATAHATMFTRGINGVASDHYTGSCIGCHTVGWDDGVANNGFDDVAAANGWAMPGLMAAGNWDSLVATKPAVAKLANIQCENCHGPQDSVAHTLTWDSHQTPQPFTSPRISYSAELCASCHAAGAHHIYSEWTTSADDGMGHSNRAGALLADSASGLNSSCGRCHAAQGYTLYANLLQQGKVAMTSVPAATLALVTPANVEPVTCTACHDPHDATNPQQLRFYGDTPNLPSGFAGHGMGKGALCLTCHNSRNGAQNGSDSLTYLHEDGEAYNSGNPTGYSAPHQAAQGDVFVGRNAYFMGASLPMTSKHAAVEDTCVGCHMTLQPKGYLSHGAPAKSGHLFRIEGADQQALCANCHGATVDGEGIQGQVEAQLNQLANAMGNAVKAKLNGFPGGLVRVRVWDEATDYYSSASASNVVLDVVANPVTSVGIEEVHGQIGFILHFATPITVPFVDAAGNPAPSKAMTAFGVQMGAIKDNQATPASIYGLSGNLVRAGWNYFLVEGDQSLGLHNPSFVTGVLNATMRKDLSN
ncbi:MAG TPA: cytochrome c3 family protein [Kofleriaceae bacterium]|nr:cytochrome c3 family protein [Kofleriaceae bacterium]